LVQGVKQYFEKVMDSFLFDRYPDIIVNERSVQDDHVHIMIEIPPKYAVSKIVGEIKAHTAKKLRKHFEYMHRADEVWSIGYFVSTIGINEQVIRAYIQNQETQDTGRAELVLEKMPRG
jgi:putative transposase